MNDAQIRCAMLYRLLEMKALADQMGTAIEEEGPFAAEFNQIVDIIKDLSDLHAQLAAQYQ